MSATGSRSSSTSSKSSKSSKQRDFKKPGSGRGIAYQSADSVAERIGSKRAKAGSGQFTGTPGQARSTKVAINIPGRTVVSRKLRRPRGGQK